MRKPGSTHRLVVLLALAAALPINAQPTMADEVFLQDALAALMRRTSNPVVTAHGPAGYWKYQVRSFPTCKLNFDAHYPGGRTTDNFTYDAWTIAHAIDWKAFRNVYVTGTKVEFNSVRAISTESGLSFGTAEEASQAASLMNRIIQACNAGPSTAPPVSSAPANKPAAGPKIWLLCQARDDKFVNHYAVASGHDLVLADMEWKAFAGRNWPTARADCRQTYDGEAADNEIRRQMKGAAPLWKFDNVGWGPSD